MTALKSSRAAIINKNGKQINAIPNQTNSESSNDSNNVIIDTEYTRDPSWIDVPTITINEEKFVGLISVFPGLSSVAFIVEGNYFVDWGDGTSNLYSSGQKAEHYYDYESLSSSIHEQMIYKQAIITVTPQNGNHITKFNFQAKAKSYSSSTTDTHIESGWLEMHMRLPYMTSLRLAQNAYIDVFFLSPFPQSIDFAVYMRMLKAVYIYDCALTDLSYLFNACSALEDFSINSNQTITAVYGMFYECWQLAYPKLFDTSAVSSFSFMFAGCRSLKAIPNYDISSSRYFGYTFWNCTALEVAPAFTFNNANCIAMFRDCSSLKYVGPPFSFSGITTDEFYRYTAVWMFWGCERITSLVMDTFNKTLNTGIIITFNNPAALNYVSVPNLGPNVGDISLFSGLPGLTRIQIDSQSINDNLDVSNCALDAEAIDHIYEKLLPITTGKTIRITGNPGAGLDNRSIATTKGWTVNATT